MPGHRSSETGHFPEFPPMADQKGEFKSLLVRSNATLEAIFLEMGMHLTVVVASVQSLIKACCCQCFITLLRRVERGGLHRRNSVILLLSFWQTKELLRLLEKENLSIGLFIWRWT
ncbi:hypothetical protein Nepgr_007271 [Nepenthes gracilis]|uniref:Uncharacterized protein n=1 Tax=Nepenthes gracilis TaxID=150966 RepID=A0AAD3XIC3_NEPGR|nr:hypothetical protein Nepgr_007271 [Nepenthes gracilis]